MVQLKVEDAQTLQELEDIAKIESDVVRQLKNKKCTYIFDSAKSLYDRARVVYKEGDKLNAYVYFLRAASICMIIQELPTKNEFAKTSEGKDYIHIFDCILNDLTHLKESLHSYFQDKEFAKTIDQALRIEDEKPFIKAPEDDLVKDADGNVLPKDIVAYAKKEKKVLIIDYRNNAEICIDFKGKSDGENITVALCPAHFISSDLTLNQLAKTMPIKERPKVTNIEKYDLVVFMDLNDPVKVKDGQYDPPASYLMRGLTDYAHNNKLKRAPVFMKGGFKMWQMTYGIYTDQEFNKSAFQEDDEFGKLLNSCRKSTVSFDYPSLATPDPPWPSSNGQQSKFVIPDAEIKWRPNPLPDAPPLTLPNPLENSYVTYQNGVQTTSFSTTAHAPPITRQIPAVDRSLKPLHLQQPPNLPPKLVPKALPVIEVRGGARPVIPPKNQPQSATPPPLQPNGYNRTDTPQQIGFESVTSIPQPQPETPEDKKEPIVPPRPPLPNRSTKVLANSPELSNLKILYHSAYGHLRSRATQGRPEYGVGFINMGNTCFMNTTLQALMNTPGMKDIFHHPSFLELVNLTNRSGTKGLITTVFSSLMDLYWSDTVRVIRPDIFLNTFADEVNRSLADRRQHDAQEFQIYLMDALHEDTNQVEARKGFEQNYDARNLKLQADDYERKQKEFAHSPISKLFNIRTVSIISCTICQTKSATFEEMSQISLELEATGFQQLNNSLEKHFKREVLEDDCRWNCPKCRRPQVAFRETFIWRLPRTLVIHFKRFTQYGMNYVKNDAHVKFDVEQLSLEKFVHPEARKNAGLYSLYAITNHSGSLNSGHYTSIVKKGHQWLKYDDDYASIISRENIASNKAFVLFYTLF